MKNLYDWLEDKIYERGTELAASAGASEFGIVAGALRAQAQMDGYRVEDLEEICGGDIATYLLVHAGAAGVKDVAATSNHWTS